MNDRIIKPEVGDVVMVDVDETSRYTVREIVGEQARLAAGRTDPGFWANLSELTVTYRPER